METKFIVIALAFFLLFGMATVEAQGWEDDWSDSSNYESDYAYTCCGSSFIILALGLALVSYKHF